MSAKDVYGHRLGVLALIALWWTFVGFGSSPKPQKPNRRDRLLLRHLHQPGGLINRNQSTLRTSLSEGYRAPHTAAWCSRSARNIFAYYEKPVPTPAPVVVPTPTPPPPPTVTLSAVSPATVYARTDDFTLEATGDKFTPAVHINIDGRDLPTRFVSAQQLSAVVPAAMIANAGQRTISVASNDGVLWSAKLPLSIAAPPTPNNFSYIGALLKKHNVGDTAFLLDKNNKEMQTVQRGDVIGGRFRVTSIAESELVVVDINLKIKHTIQKTNDGDKGGSFPQGRPTPRVAAEDDEP